MGQQDLTTRRILKLTTREHHRKQFSGCHDLQFLLLLLLLLHPFNGLFSRTTWVSRYQKGKTSLDLNEAEDDGGFGIQ